MDALGRHWKKIALAVIFVISLFVPFFVQNNYFLGVIILGYIWAIATYGLNILLGYTGQLSLGHAGFFGIGAYTVGVLTVGYEFPFWPSLLIAVIASSVLGFLIGIFALRTRNEYFAIFTLGVGFVIYLVIERWEGLTGGALGLIGVPYPEGIGPIQFDGPGSLYYLILGFLILTIYIAWSIANSLVGRSFMAIRNSEELAAATGINVGRAKQLAFAISTGVAGLAGGLYATYIGFLGPAIVNVPTTFEILLYLLVGGMGSLSGPLVGAFLVTTLFQFLQQFEAYRLVILGPLVVIIIIFFPKGLAGLWHAAETRIRKRMNKNPAPDESSESAKEEAR
ncbi:MAG: branched-chain amino acid ABC transporter permease [Actinomycetota bacterium]|jgi:branched-chain amino acid transport system permease protein|nr:branched-chain amino acid ABC transporter permease [Rubrobacter sp.]MDQ3509452.1 branched-chain amino acid ABC transporter permease [Actinomycetota bacterium]